MPLTPAPIPSGAENARLCADCGLLIARLDLQRRPQALFCRRCESERERRRAHPGASG